MVKRWDRPEWLVGGWFAIVSHFCGGIWGSLLEILLFGVSEFYTGIQELD